MTKIFKMDNGLISFKCPACKETHQIRTPPWTFNGDDCAPTFRASILVAGKQIKRDENGHWKGEYIRNANGDPLDRICHSFVTDGKIEYLSDCTHKMAGQTVELPDWQGDE